MGDCSYFVDMTGKRRKGVGSSSSGPAGDDVDMPEAPVVPPNGDEFMGLRNLNDVQKARWRVLASRKVGVTKFCHWPTVVEWGLDGMFELIVQRGNLGTFLHKNAQTYKRYTLEFLSTVEVWRAENANDPRIVEDWITFRMNDANKRVRYSTLRSIFGFPPPRARDEDEAVEPNEPTCEEFWFAISEADSDNDSMRMFNIDHPVWRLLARYLVTTIFGRGEPSKPTLAMAGAMYSCVEEGPTAPDWVDLFVKACMQNAAKKTGNIMIGGMITLIYEHFMRDPIEHPASADLVKVRGVENPHLYTKENLLKLGGIDRKDDAEDVFWRYGPNERYKCSLPRMIQPQLPSGPGRDDWSIGEAHDESTPMERAAWEHLPVPVRRRRAAGVPRHAAAAAAPWDARFGAIDARLDQMWGVQQEMQQQQTAQYGWQREQWEIYQAQQASHFEYQQQQWQQHHQQQAAQYQWQQEQWSRHHQEMDEMSQMLARFGVNNPFSGPPPQ